METDGCYWKVPPGISDLAVTITMHALYIYANFSTLSEIENRNAPVECQAPHKVTFSEAIALFARLWTFRKKKTLHLLSSRQWENYVAFQQFHIPHIFEFLIVITYLLQSLRKNSFNFKEYSMKVFSCLAKTQSYKSLCEVNELRLPSHHLFLFKFLQFVIQILLFPLFIPSFFIFLFRSLSERIRYASKFMSKKSLGKTESCGYLQFLPPSQKEPLFSTPSTPLLSRNASCP